MSETGQQKQQQQPLNQLLPMNEVIHESDSRQQQQSEQLVQLDNILDSNVKHSSTPTITSAGGATIRNFTSQSSAAVATAKAPKQTLVSGRTNSRQINFKSLSEATTVIQESDELSILDPTSASNNETVATSLISNSNATTTIKKPTNRIEANQNKHSESKNISLADSESDDNSRFSNAPLNIDDTNPRNQQYESSEGDDHLSDEDGTRLSNLLHDRDEHVDILKLTTPTSSTSRRKRRLPSSSTSTTTGGFLVGSFLAGLKSVSSTFGVHSDTYSTPYVAYEDKDLLTGDRKYSSGSAGAGGGGKRGLASSINASAGRTFRGSYKYSRIGIGMAILNKLFGFLFKRSTASLLGAFLIHVTLGTIYTLSNINSYLTSYMRKHGSPNATYGSAMWISSLYSVGQGFSMILGGYIEKRFSARVACILGCATHSLSIMATSYAVDHGPLAVLFTYGFLPGFGCGLSYMTPMSNGFGWFPNRRGLVAGTILAGFGIGTFVFNMAQTAYVNPDNLSPLPNSGGYFTQDSILDRVPHLFVFIGSIYASMQFIGCCLLFKPPNPHGGGKLPDERPILVENEITLKRAVRTREFLVLFLVFGTTNQGVLFVNSMLKEYGQIFIGNDMYLAWTGSMASIANSLGRLVWGLAIDRYSFTQCFTCITIIFGSLMFIMPFEFILSSKLLYLLCTLGIFGSFSGWMSTYPVHISRVFGRSNSGMIYGLIFVSQAIGGIFTALGAHYLIDHFSRFVPFFCVTLLEVLGLIIYHCFYESKA